MGEVDGCRVLGRNSLCFVLGQERHIPTFTCGTWSPVFSEPVRTSICTYYVEYNITYFFLHFRSFAGINPQRGTKSAGKGGTNAKVLSLINALHDFESDWKSCDWVHRVRWTVPQPIEKKYISMMIILSLILDDSVRLEELRLSLQSKMNSASA